MRRKWLLWEFMLSPGSNAIGTKIWASMPRNENVGGSTPTITYGSPFSVMRLPTTRGSPPKRRCHSPSVRITHAMRAPLLLLRRRNRGRVTGCVPRASKSPADTINVGTRSGLAAAGQVEEREIERLELVERPVLCAISVEVGRRGQRSTPGSVVDGLDEHSCSGSRYGSGRSSSVLTTLNITVLAPMPMASEDEDDEREARIPPHQPQREAEILESGVEPGKTCVDRGAPLSSAPGRPASPAPAVGLPQGSCRAKVVVDVHLECARQLVVEFAIIAGAVGERPDTPEPRARPAS